MSVPFEENDERPSVDPLLSECLTDMAAIYREDPDRAVRGQAFIKELHQYLGNALEDSLSPEARRRGITVKYERSIFGSHKPKDVDVAVLDPDNGPLLLVGVRSQMSSIGKNALNYYEGIIGECISLQDRFPLAVHGYLYLMPARPIKEDRESEAIDHRRWARLYGAITGRAGIGYDRIRGLYDQFAYMVADFESDPPEIRDELLGDEAERLAVGTFVSRLIKTTNDRMLFLRVFEDD
jgi:hypothetical protein